MKLYDPDIRKLLYRKFTQTEEFTSDPETKIVNEMDVCFGISRIDVAVINGRLHGYEIKSEQDTLERLCSQIDAYNKVFDTITIVTAENHISKILDMVPDWWEIYYVSKDNNVPTLIQQREFKINKQVNSFYLAQVLWKNELLELLNLHGIKKETKNKTRFALCSMVSENITQQEIKKFVREKLKSRKSWKAVPLQQLYDDSLQ